MFSDHYSFPIMLELPKRETFHLLESIWGLWHILLWIFLGKGLFARTTVPSAAYIRTGAIDTETMSVKSHEADGTDNLDASQPKNRPDFEIMIMPNNGLQRPVPGHAFLNFHPTIIQPHATGRIELVSHRSDCHLALDQTNEIFRRARTLTTTLASSTQCSPINETWPLRDSLFDLQCAWQLNFRTQDTRIQPRLHLLPGIALNYYGNGSSLVTNGARPSRSLQLSHMRASPQSRRQVRAKLGRM